MNSNRWINTELREEYREANIWDELSEWFPQEGNESLVPIGKQVYRISRRYSCRQEIHHVSGGILGTPRWDIVTNLIGLSRVTHEFCERYCADGFALCAAHKIKKNEWDRQRMAEIMHVDSVCGWLETRVFWFPWAEKVFQEHRQWV